MGLFWRKKERQEKTVTPVLVAVIENTTESEIFQDILRVYKTTDFGKSMEFHFSCEREVVLMPGDYDRLRQVFLNIMNNAIKFSPDDGNVWVSIQVADQIVVTIRDEGIGISKEEIPFVFEKFYKSKLRQNAKGSGLGLMSAKHIVEKHDGTIQVESGLGEGTEFKIIFPFIIAFIWYLPEKQYSANYILSNFYLKHNQNKKKQQKYKKN